MLHWNKSLWLITNSHVTILINHSASFPISVPSYALLKFLYVIGFSSFKMTTLKGSVAILVSEILDLVPPKDFGMT